MATSSKQLETVRIHINWGLPATEKQVPPGSMPLNPSFKEKRLAITRWFQFDPNDPQVDAMTAQISHLEVMQPTVDSSGQSFTHPIILAVRSQIPAAGSGFAQEPQSIVNCWELVTDQQPATHPSFQQLPSKGTVSAPSVRCLRFILIRSGTYKGLVHFSSEEARFYHRQQSYCVRPHSSPLEVYMLRLQRWNRSVPG